MTNVLLAIVCTLIIVAFGEVDWGFEATIVYLAMILVLNTYDIKNQGKE